MTLLRCLSLIVLSQYLLWILPAFTASNFWWMVPVSFLLTLFAGLSLVGLFVLVHDCGHYAFSKSVILNDLVGFLSFIPMLNSFYAWRAAHDFHHRNNQIRKVDPDWPELLATDEEWTRIPWHEKLAVRLGPGHATGLVIGFWVGMLKRKFFFVLIPQMKMTRKEALLLTFQNILSVVLSVVFIVSYFRFLGTDKFLLMYGGPVIVATITGAFLTFIQHSHPGSYVFDQGSFDPVLSQVHSTVNVRFHPFLEFMWLKINIHLPHHILAGIPWYHLEKSSEALKRIYPKDVREVTFSWRMLKDCWESTRLEAVRPGIFRLTKRVSF